VKLKYAGPKPLISYSGINFDNNKEDKYVYLNVVAQLINAIDHDYIADKTYIYNTSSQRLSDDEIVTLLRSHDANILIKAQERVNASNDDITEMLQRARHNQVLEEENINILVKNIILMREYMLQRSFNKSIYYSAINVLAELLKTDHIDFVIAPMFAKYVHVFHSVQGVFSGKKIPIESKIDIYTQDGKLFVKLDVITL
jgi:hypothetical protein